MVPILESDTPVRSPYDMDYPLLISAISFLVIGSWALYLTRKHGLNK